MPIHESHEAFQCIIRVFEVQEKVAHDIVHSLAVGNIFIYGPIAS